MKRTLQTCFSPAAIALLLLTVLAVACKKEKKEDTTPPVITGVTNLLDRASILESADFDQWILIKGQHLATTFKVDFNGEIAFDSLVYANDTVITVKIPKTLPDPINNPITVYTKYGTATYNFRILQPPPVITGFDPVAGPEGSQVTILGDFFNGVTSVKFNDVEVPIISSSKSTITVQVPVGQTYGYVYVTTPVGTAKSEKVFGFKLAVYDEALATGWSNTSFSCTANYAHTDTVKRGTYALRAEATAAWGALRVTKAAPAIDLTGYSGVKFSVYGGQGSEGKKVKLMINGVTATGYTVTLKAGQWTDFQIPLSSLGNPTTVSTLTFQEFSGIKQLLYYDDIGLY